MHNFPVVRDLKDLIYHFRKHFTGSALVKLYDALDGLQNNPKGVKLGNGNDKTRKNKTC